MIIHTWVTQKLIFALIQFYRIETGDQDLMNVPYKAVSVSNVKNTLDLTWSLNDFPIKLRYILYKFIILHSNSMKEEEDRKDIEVIFIWWSGSGGNGTVAVVVASPRSPQRGLPRNSDLRPSVDDCCLLN